MFRRLLHVQTSNPDVTARGRLLKAAALMVALAGLAYLPVSLSAVENPLWSLMTLLVAGLVFSLAHSGHTRTGAVLFIASLLLLITFSPPPEELINRSAGLSYVIPILVTGLVLGAQAVLIVGALSLAAIAMVALLNGIPFSTETYINSVLLLTVTGLLWLIIRTLERALRAARQEADRALAVQHELSAREQALVTANQELSTSNTQMESLLHLIHELETPVIPLLDGVLVAPLVGHLDSRRVEQINQAVLDAVYAQRARVVIIDITGISNLDTAVAQRLEHLAQSIQLLGARVLLTGISAHMAQTIIELGLNFASIQTAGRLQDGVALVLQEYEVSSSEFRVSS